MPDGWRLTSLGSDITLTALESLAQELLRHAKHKRIWLFFGEMGAGKTTLIKTLARQLGVREAMSSPTFSIVNEYAAGPSKIYHMDLYRLNSEKEILDTGLEEYFDSGAYCLVEWPEKLGRLTPPSAMKIRITAIAPDHRKIEYLSV